MENEELSNSLNQIYIALATTISAICRSIPNKEDRIDALKKINPPIEHLKAVYQIAIEREDYETCDAIKNYFQEKGINY
ncbi:hypothetical protein [Flavobacterium sp. KMS]|uniref:hypothetical protein n=1 Tax=Flavobacterium sp. KMS TaxID=1566023 RepID=UPI000A3ED76B|nr:hypothetical protein [Flavobacterium sp. KMS]